MKTIKLNSSILWVICVALPFNMLAQAREIPITTSSSEALKFFKDGRDKSGGNTIYRQNLDTAISLADKV